MKFYNKIKRNIIIAVVSLVSLYVIYGIFAYINIFASVNYLKTGFLSEYVRFNIYGNSFTDEGDTISAKISIIDSNLNEICGVERSWNGNCLSIEFQKLQIGNSCFYFPSKIYGKKSILDKSIPKNVTSLEKYYDENGQCILLSSSNSKKKQRSALYVLSRFSNRKLMLPTFGFIKRTVVDLYECENGKFYSIVTDDEGKLKVVEL